jgi:hypothetical protein
MTTTLPHLEKIARQWRRQTTARDVLFALAGALLLAALTVSWPLVSWVAGTSGFFAILAGRLRRSRPWTLNAASLSRHLDRAYPALEESSALWLRRPGSLTLLERLQLKRLNAAALGMVGDEAPIPFGAPPKGFLQLATWCLAGSVAALVGMAAVQRERTHQTPLHRVIQSAHPAPAVSAAAAPTWPKIVAGDLQIAPPAYTGRPAHRVDGLNAQIEEGASVTWQLELDRSVRDARLVFGEAGANSLPLRALPGTSLRLEGARVVTDAGLYHLAATLPDGTAWSPPDLFSLKIIRDRPPVVRILEPALPRTLLASPAAPLTISVLASDDYGLVDAHLVATVAKGAGEAVKFREQTIPFDTNESAADPTALPGARQLVKTLNLAVLGLEPGDELYFFVEATDNRQPVANRTRSETRFVTIKGPVEAAPAGGLGVGGVNLVPRYFRSERQIIIDTEKLIADQPTLAADEFRRRSNDLGFDQQLLRLRYGQFVGEDYEQSAVTDHTEIQLDPLQATSPQRTGPHAAASVATRFLQEHAEQDRGGVDPEHDTGVRTPPDHPLSADQVRAPYVDQHDSQDKATFFDHETKGTLREALADMWQVEGLLRTTRPREALAPEHRVLDILKELQQSARAYVQHVGFDPPPLKIAERRLQGDVATVPARANVPAEVPPAGVAARSLAETRAALAAVPWSEPPSVLTPAQLSALRRIEPALTVAATARPETFLPGLQALRRLSAGGDARSGDDLVQLEHALFHLLPAAGALPDRASDPAPSLARSYFEGLVPTKPGEVR